METLKGAVLVNKGKLMNYKFYLLLGAATILSGCGNDFEIVTSQRYAELGITIKDCKKDHNAASPVCTVQNGADIAIPNGALEYSCYDRQGNMLYAPGNGKFPNRTIIPGASAREKFYCQNAEDLSRIEFN